MIRFQILIFIFLTLVSCATSSQKSLGDIIFSSSLSLFSSSESLPIESIVKQKNFSIMHVRLGNDLEATLELAYIKNGIYEWRGNNNIKIFTKNGLIIETQGLISDVIYKNSIDSFDDEDFFLTYTSLSNPDLLFATVNNELFRLDNSKKFYKGKERTLRSYKIIKSVPSIGWTSSSYYYTLGDKVVFSKEFIHPRLPILEITYYY